MTSDGLLLELDHVTKGYDGPDGAPAITVLDDISLAVSPGESLAIIGPSGSGKSTLLHIMGTLDRPTAGVVSLRGQDLNKLDEKRLAAVRNQQLGFVFQLHYLLPQCTVLENVLVPTLAGHRTDGEGSAASKVGSQGAGSLSSQGTATGQGRDESPGDRAVRLLKRVGLAERLSYRPGQLSGGERQRVAVVRALINQPQLLLADEPTGALDQASAEQLAQLLIQLNHEEGVALIVVTHARDLARRMGRMFELKRGRLAACEPEK